MTDPNHTACSPIAVPRRAALSLGFAAVVGLAAAALARAEAGGIKVTALYGNPKNPEEFEKYYAGTHMPLVYDVKEIKRSELALGIPGPDGKPPPFYRITELYFDSAEQLKQAAETAQWKSLRRAASPYSYRRSHSCPTTARPARDTCGLLVALGRCSFSFGVSLP